MSVNTFKQLKESHNAEVTYLDIIQFLAIEQIRIDLVDRLTEVGVLKQAFKYNALKGSELSEQFQREFFNSGNLLEENDLLINHMTVGIKALLDQIEIN